MVSSILRSLIHLQNPWLGGGGLDVEWQRRAPAEYVERLEAAGLAAALEDDRRAHLVVGPRQAGKSTLVWRTLSCTDRPVLYLNCEEPLIREWCRSPGLFVGDLDEWLPEGGILFLEEAQWLEEAGLFAKGLIDAHCGRTVVVTGSASFHLMSRTRESLAGRATRRYVWPLSLSEVAPPVPGVVPAVQRARADAAIERMMITGSYPGVWTSATPERELSQLLTAYVLRDASDRFRIGRPDAFRKLLVLVARQVGDLINYSEWSRILGIAGTTVAEYIGLLEETHILATVRPFIGGKRAEVTSTPKVYLLDNGLRNALAGGFAALDQRVDVGKLFENWVFSELHKRFPAPGQIRFWRTRGGAEVDFIVEPRPGHLVAIEAKASSTTPRLTRSLRSFVAAYSVDRMLMVHRGERVDLATDTLTVEVLPAADLPTVLDGLIHE